MEHDASALSHVAILCRELEGPADQRRGGARAQLRGRLVAIDGGSGELEILAGPTAVVAQPPLVVLGKQRSAPSSSCCGSWPRVGPGHHRPRRSSGSRGATPATGGAESVRLTMHGDAAEQQHLEMLDLAHFGLDFSPMPLLLGLLRHYGR